jgi:hypothetical protein
LIHADLGGTGIMGDNETLSDVIDSEPGLLPSTTGNHAASDLQVLVDATLRFTQNSKAANTRRAYQSDWRAFSGWCRKSGFRELPAQSEVVALYLSHLATAGRKEGRHHHQNAGLDLSDPPDGWAPVTDLGLRGLGNRKGPSPHSRNCPGSEEAGHGGEPPGHGARPRG